MKGAIIVLSVIIVLILVFFAALIINSLNSPADEAVATATPVYVAETYNPKAAISQAEPSLDGQIPTVSPVLMMTPTPFPSLMPTSSPMPSPTPVLVRLVAIDAGHQLKSNNGLEPLGPDSSEMKAKVSSGTSGISSGIAEHELNLDVALLLRDELIARGYDVYMIRETSDVDISNAQRAAMATEAGADIFVRIHANGDASSATNGIMTISPSSRSPYIPDLYEDSYALSQFLLEGMLAETGAVSKGIWETDTMTGINWATMPVSIVEMGYMTNPEEDRLLQDHEYRQKLVTGMANGIDMFFEGKG